MKLINIVGARPQFIKVAPILRAIQHHNKTYIESPIQEILIHTGQHYDYKMSGVFFDELGLKSPDYHLGIGSGTHGYQTGEMLKRIEETLIKEKPDIVMVYGDTNTTLAGALAGVKLHIPIAHVEAGLRSFNKRMPEEINRMLTDHISTLLFCPTETAVNNLRQEGINEGIHLVGDIMYDSALLYLELAEEKSQILSQLTLKPKEYALATVHRAENTDDFKRLKAIFSGLEEIARSGLPVIFPLHPRTRKAAEAFRLSLTKVRVLEPISYLDMLLLEKNAHIILTDSGGVQKEAFFFRVPCITLRDETEWVETVEAGWNTVVGCDQQKICQAVLEAKPGRKASWPYGDGKASEKTIKELKCWKKTQKDNSHFPIYEKHQ